MPMSRTVRMLIILAIVAVVILYVGFLTARAEGGKCGAIADVEQFVTGKEYSEHAIFDASVACGRGECPLRIFGNAQTGTWTIIVQPQPGIACIFLGGENLTPAKQAPKGKPL